MPATAKRGRRQLRSEETRRDILDAAVRLLGGQGLGSTTMRGVAGEAGSSDAAVFFHFGSRQGLLEAVLRHAQTSWLKAMEGEVSRPGLSPREAILAMVDRAVEWASANPELMRAASALQTEMGAFPALVAGLRANLEENAAALCGPIDRAAGEGVIRPISGSRGIDFLEFVFGALQGIVARAGASAPDGDAEPQLRLLRAAALHLLGLEEPSNAPQGATLEPAHASSRQ